MNYVAHSHYPLKACTRDVTVIQKPGSQLCQALAELPWASHYPCLGFCFRKWSLGLRFWVHLVKHGSLNCSHPNAAGDGCRVDADRGNYDSPTAILQSRRTTLPPLGGSERALGISGLKSPGAETIQPSAVPSRDGAGFSKVMREIP